jgi:hypothetical protein
MPKDAKKVWCAIHQKLEPLSTELCHHAGQVPVRIVASRKEIFGSMLDRVTALMPGRSKKKKLSEIHLSLSPLPEPPQAVASGSATVSTNSAYPSSRALPAPDEFVPRPAADDDVMLPGSSPSPDQMHAIDLGHETEGLGGIADGDDDEVAVARDAVHQVQEHVWANHTCNGTATVEDYTSDDGEDDNDDEEEDDGFVSESEDEEEYDEGLSPEDMINEEFEHELAELGGLIVLMFIS